MTTHTTSNGVTFKTYLVEYEIPISSASAEALRARPAQAGGLINKLRPLLGANLLSTQLAITDDNGWAIYITLSAKGDTPEAREFIATTLLGHIDVILQAYQAETTL